MAETNRAAIVRGSLRGIGAAAAERLPADGLTFCINYTSKPEQADALASKISPAGGRALPVRADVSDPASVAANFDQVESEFGGVDFAAKAGMDALAVCYARELAPFGIETSIIVPGAFTKGTNHFHFLNPGMPDDHPRVAAYDADYPSGFANRMKDAPAATVPEDADPEAVALAVAAVVDAPFGNRPLRVHVDPAEDSAAVSFAVDDRVRTEFLHWIEVAELLHLTRVAAP